MNFTKLATGAALALGIALLSSPAAKANVILAYTGNVFTVFSAPYTGTDKVTASITLANPLGDNLNFASVTPLAFSLSDGVQTITNELTQRASFIFSTDSTGTIILWNVAAFTPTSTSDEIATINNIRTTADFTVRSGPIESSVNNDPGTWTVTTVPVPEPPLSNLAAFGVLGLAFFWRRGRQIFGLGRAQ
jgi:hypothetical protein